MAQFHYPAHSGDRMGGVTPYQQWVLDHCGDDERAKVLDALYGKFGRGLSMDKAAILADGFSAMLSVTDPGSWERTAILGAQMGIWAAFEDGAESADDAVERRR